MSVQHFDADTEALIDRYLRRELNTTDETGFEQRMARDAVLFEEVQLRRDIILGIRVAERKAIRTLLDQTAQQQRVTAQYQPTREALPLPNWVRWVVYGAVAAGVGATAYWLGWL